jgi:hypothetical protein
MSPPLASKPVKDSLIGQGKAPGGRWLPHGSVLGLLVRARVRALSSWPLKTTTQRRMSNDTIRGVGSLEPTRSPPVQ